MGRDSFKKVTALILCAALIFQNSALTYGIGSEPVRSELPDAGAYTENGAVTGTAIRATTDSEIRSMTAEPMAETDYDTSWYNGEDSSFAIINGEQLRGLAHLVNGTAVNTSGTAIVSKDFSGKIL